MLRRNTQGHVLVDRDLVRTLRWRLPHRQRERLAARSARLNLAVAVRGHDAFLERLVVAQPQEHGLAQQALGRPRQVAHLDDELGLDPDVLPAARQGPGAGRGRATQTVESVRRLTSSASSKPLPARPQ